MIIDLKYNFQLPVFAILLSLKYWLTLLFRVWINSCESFLEKRGINLLAMIFIVTYTKLLNFKAFLFLAKN